MNMMFALLLLSWAVQRSESTEDGNSGGERESGGGGGCVQTESEKEGGGDEEDPLGLMALHGRMKMLLLPLLPLPPLPCPDHVLTLAIRPPHTI